ncbi:Mechanosensitive ion channel protein BA [Exophiala dermatitidis]
MATKDAIVTVHEAGDDITPLDEKQFIMSPGTTTTGFEAQANAAGGATASRPKPRVAHQVSDLSVGHGFGNDRSLTSLGIKWQRLRKNVLIRYTIYIVPVAILLAIPIILFATVYKGRKIVTSFTDTSLTPVYTSNITSVDGTATSNITSIYNNTAATIYQQSQTTVTGGIHYLGLFIWIEVVWVLLWVAKLLAQLVPVAFQSIAGAIHTGIRKYRIILQAVEIPLSLFFWAILAISSFSIIYTFDRSFHSAHAGKIHWLSVLHKVNKATIGVTALYLVEKVLIQMVSVNYHGKQFYDHIKELKTLSRALETMYDVSRRRFPDNHPAFRDEDLDIHDVRGYRSSNKTAKTGVALDETAAILMTNLGTTADRVTSVLGYLVSDIAGRQVLNPTASGPIVEAALDRQASAEALARRIWNSFTSFGHTPLDLQSIATVLGPGRETQAEYIHRKLDADANGDITLEEMVELVKRVAAERKSIWEGASNVKDAIKVLDRVLSLVVLIFVFLIYAAFFSDYLATHYTQVWSAFTGCSFLFASTAGELFAACITVFIKHPYDVGDRINVDGKDMDVVKISLLYSIFREVASRQMVQIPNSILNGLWIKNISRSKDLREQLTVHVSAGTSFEDLDALKRELDQFVSENKRDFAPEVDLQLVSVQDLKQLELKIEFQHKGGANFASASEHLRAQHRSKFVGALLAAVRKVPIDRPGGSGPAAGSIESPTYTVAISDDVAKAARQRFDHEVDSKRLVPKMGLKLEQQQQQQHDTRAGARGQGDGASVTTAVSTGRNEGELRPRSTAEQ